jgi:hypothetical protein
MSRRAHQPDPSQRRQVEAMAAYGIPETDIARTVGIDPKTLRKCYREELDLGTTKANAQVAGFLFTAAKNGNVTAQIFWLKTRARWKEAPAEFKHSGAVGTYDANRSPMQSLSGSVGEVCEPAPWRTLCRSRQPRQPTSCSSGDGFEKASRSGPDIAVLSRLCTTDC